MAKLSTYMIIADTLEKQIRRGVLAVGEKLPSLRTIRGEYGVSMNTASRAYIELERRLLIESRPQSGFYVSRSPKQGLAMPAPSRPMAQCGQELADILIDRVMDAIASPSLVRLSLGVPDSSLLPVAKLRKATEHAIRSSATAGVDYVDVQGLASLRRQIARWSFAWGGTLGEQEIMTTSGALNAISYCLRATTRPGDMLAVESPVYFGLLQLARSLGLKVLELPTHPESGVDVDALREALPRIKACLLIPNFNNPLGSCMPDSHKAEVVRMLARHGVPLIEDDLYGDVYFGSSRPKPCKAFDTEGNVLWCGSASKTLAPGYRVGWTAPGKYLREVMRLKMFNTISTTYITEKAVATFLETGRYDHHLRHLRKTLHTNQLRYGKAIHDYFPEGTKVSQPRGGFVVWVELPHPTDTAQLYDDAVRHGITLAPGRMFTLQEQFSNCMRLSFGLPWSEQVDGALKKLGRLAAAL